MSSKTVLYSILNWGLGHATRSIPIIRALLDRGYKVVIISTGRSLSLLRREFGSCVFVDLPDYNVRYSRHGWLLIPHLLLQMPAVFIRLHREHGEAERLAILHKADLIVSDNRYGCYSKQIPSYLITHQLRFQLPKWLEWSAWISEWFNRFYFRHYRNVLVPDENRTPNLSGDLSHRGRITNHPKLRFVGPLSSLNSVGTAVKEDIDVLFLISGPEPHRTMLEDLIMTQIEDLPGKKVIVLGKPEASGDPHPWNRDDLKIHPHLVRECLADFMRRARLVVSRAGYSTVMELMAAGRKAVLIPTPGQTEQEYLAEHLMETGLFFSVRQDELDLKRMLAEAERFYVHPVPKMDFNRTGEILSIIENGLGPRQLKHRIP
jgi:uncharacterized protein (TIGR00661 family)